MVTRCTSAPCVLAALVVLACMPVRAESVRFLLPDGSPAAGGRVISVPAAGFVHIRNGEIVKHYGDPAAKLPADGRLEISAKNLGRHVVLHRDGWADTGITAATREVRLHEWHTVRGHATGGDSVGFSRSETRARLPDERGSVFWTSEAPVAADGAFAIPCVPAGPGVVGIMREYRDHRRVQRWKDFPVAVTVPAATGISLGDTGVMVQGRLPASVPRPAMVTLVSRTGDQPPRHAVAGTEGTFSVPGVQPGEFRLSARPLDGTSTQLQHEFTLANDGQPLDLGELAPADTSVEVYRMVEYPDGLIAKVRAAAEAQSRRPIRKIWLGQLAHPLDLWGARVTFEPEPIDATHAVARTFIVQIPGEAIRKYYPEFGTEGFGYRFTEGEFFKPRLVETPVRSFPLATRTVFLPVSENLAYDSVLALLRAIEAGSWKRPQSETTKGPKGKWTKVYSSGADISPDDLDAIESIERTEPGARIRVKTRDGDFRGRVIEFEERGGEYFLVAGSRWVA